MSRALARIRSKICVLSRLGRSVQAQAAASDSELQEEQARQRALQEQAQQAGERVQFLREDLAQRSFINAAQRAGGWRGGSFKSWLFRICVNLSKNHVRDTARFDRSDEASEAEAEPTAPEAHDKLEAAEQREALRKAVAQLPKRQREVLLMRIDGDLPFAEIAHALDITEVNAKVNFHHAVQKLKEWVKPD